MKITKRNGKILRDIDIVIVMVEHTSLSLMSSPIVIV